MYHLYRYLIGDVHEFLSVYFTGCLLDTYCHTLLTLPSIRPVNTLIMDPLHTHCLKEFDLKPKSGSWQLFPWRSILLTYSTAGTLDVILPGPMTSEVGGPLIMVSALYLTLLYRYRLLVITLTPRKPWDKEVEALGIKSSRGVGERCFSRERTADHLTWALGQTLLASTCWPILISTQSLEERGLHGFKSGQN